MPIAITNNMLYYIHITTNEMLVLNQQASGRKENNMEDMTDLQFKAIINAIIQIIKDNDDKAEMIKKIEALVNKN